MIWKEFSWFIPPQAVKSIFVWNAKIVSPKVTPAVIPMAYRIASASKRAQKQPSMKPSAAVKTPKKITFFGNLRRTPETVQKITVTSSSCNVHKLVCNEYYVCTTNAIFAIFYLLHKFDLKNSASSFWKIKIILTFAASHGDQANNHYHKCHPVQDRIAPHIIS